MDNSDLILDGWYNEHTTVDNNVLSHCVTNVFVFFSKRESGALNVLCVCLLINRIFDFTATKAILHIYVILFLKMVVHL